MATYDNLDLVRTSIEYRDITNTTNPNYNFGTRTFSFADIELLEGIPAQDQLEIERIFPVNTLGSSKYEGVQLTIADRRLMFKLPKQWFTVDVINKTITIKDIANSASNDYIPAPAASTGPYYDINLGTSRTFKLLAATTPPSANQTIIIPGLAVNDDIIIRRRTVSTEKVVNFAPGSRLTSGQLNLQVSQLVNLVQELMWKVDQEFILKFDESAVDGPFLGNKDLDMGTFSIINMGMPGVDGDAFPPNAESDPEDIDRVGRMAVNKYFLQNVYTDYVSDTIVANWDAGGRSGALVTRLAGFDTSLAAKQPLNANLTTLQSTTNASGLVSLGNSSNLALVTAIGALASGNTGFIKKSGASTVTLDTNTYLTGNQSISLSGAVSGSGTTSISTTLAANAVGTSNINNLAVTNDKIADGTIANAKLANSTISSVALGGTLYTLTRGSYLTGNNYNGSAAQTFAVDAATANTANKVVARDASGNFAANTITAALSGNATTATTLQTARTIGLGGGATGTATSFDGSANISINVTALDADKITSGTLSVDRLGSDAIADAKLTNTGAAAGTYANAGFNIPEITITNKGRITGIVNRDLASSLVTNIQSNAIYWDSTNNTFVALRNSSNQTIRGVADPVLSNDAANKQWSVGQFLGLSATNYDAKNKKIVNVADPVNTYDAVNLNTLAGYSLYGGGQAVPQSIALTFGSPAQTNQAGFDRYEFTVNTLVGENPELMILTDSSNRTYRPSANSADIGNQKFWISTGANKILQVWLTTGTSVSGLTATLRNFGVSRVLTSNVASQTALGFVRVPANGGININNGDISLAEATTSVLGGVKIAANNGLALTSGTLSVVRSDAVDQTDSNTLATSTAVKTAYDAAVIAQGTASAALPLTGGTVTGALNVNGAVVLGDADTDTLTITGTAVSTPNGLNFDSNTLVVDATNNRVGIGTATPNNILHVSTTSTGTTAVPRFTSGSGYVEIGVQSSSHCHLATDRGSFYFNKPLHIDAATGYTLTSYNTQDLKLATNAVVKATLFHSTGNFTIGTGTADPSVKLYVDGEIKAKTSLILNGSTSGTSTIVAQATAGTTTFTLPTTTGTLIGSNDTRTVSNTMLAGSIADSKLSTIASANKVAISALDIDGGTDIGADLADADLIIVDDGGAGANRKAAVTRIAPYVFSKVSGDVTINASGVATIAVNSVALGTDTTGNYVATIAGTTNQVTVTGSGSESAGVTLSLPQDIHTTANPTFAGATLGTTQVGVTADNEIDTSSGNLVLDSTGGTVQVDDNLSVAGDLTLTGNSAKIKLLGSSNNDGLSIERLSAAAGDGAIGDTVLRLTPAGAETPKLFYIQSSSANPVATDEVATKAYVNTAVSGVDISGKMDVAGNTLGSGDQVLGTSTGNSGSFKIQTNGNDNLVLTPIRNAFFRNAQTLDLVGTDHCYLAFKPRGDTEGRKAYIGFGGSTSTSLVISNEDTGNISLIAGQTGLTVENGGAVKIPKLNNTFRNLTTSFTETVTITDFAQGETRYYAYKLASTSGTDYNFAFVISQTSPTTTAFTVKVDVIPEGTTPVTWNNSTGYTLQNLNYAVAAGVSLNYGLDSVQVLGQTLVLVNDGAYIASPFIIRTTFDNATWRKWMRIEVTRIF